MNTTSYDPIARFFHWTVVVAVLIQYISVLLLDEAEGTSAIVDFHMSFGIVILALMLARLVWRLYAKAPPHDASTPLWQSIAASVSHLGLYTLLTIMPIIGWLWTSALGWNVTIFGIIPLPILGGTNDNLAEVLGNLHEFTSVLILSLIALHVAAALYHWIIVRDGTMQRMWP